MKTPFVTPFPSDLIAHEFSLGDGRIDFALRAAYQMFRRSSPTKPRVALVTCVRNEARFLAAHLLYHKEIGVDRAYVFLDRCTDTTEEIAGSLPWVRALRVDPNDAERFPYVPDFQRQCMDYALSLAREEGIDWLLGIDVDEFVAVGSTRQHREQPVRSPTANLPATLARLPESTDIVRMLPQEVLPMDVAPGGPVWRQRVFLRNKHHVRETLDPRTGETFEWWGLIGHRHGKSIVRTSIDVQALDAHGWTRNQQSHYPCQPPAFRLKQKVLGRLLHYVVSDSEHWLEKHRKLSHEPSTWRGGIPVEATKQCWKVAASEMSRDEAQGYFQRWVATSDERVQEMLAKGQAFMDETVEHTLRRAAHLVGDQIQLPRQPAGTVEDWSLPSEFWKHAARETGITRMPDGGLKLHAAELPGAAIDGFGRPQYDGTETFMWSLKEASLRFNAIPGDYLLILRVARRTNWKALTLSLNGQPLPTARRKVGKREITYQLVTTDFAGTNEHELSLQYEGRKYPWPWGQPRGFGLALIDLTLCPQAASQPRRIAA